LNCSSSVARITPSFDDILITSFSDSLVAFAPDIGEEIDVSEDTTRISLLLEGFFTTTEFTITTCRLESLSAYITVKANKHQSSKSTNISAKILHFWHSKKHFNAAGKF